MKCNEFEILIDDFIEGTLPASQKEDFEKHAQECSSCKKELEETVKLLETVSLLPKDSAPAHDLWANIEGRISNKKGKIYRIKNTESLNGFSTNGDSDKKNRILKYAAISLIAAMILVALLPSIFMNKNTPLLDKVMSPYWKVTSVKGITIVASNVIGTVDSLKPGDWLETKDSSTAILEVPGMGNVTIEPNSKVQLLKSDSNEHRIALEYGTINADINSEPRTFFVDSKSATAIDLGCSYTYTVQQNGDGVLYVKEGMVALSSHGRESLVPAGKFCLAKTGIGPGTPFRENTSAAFKEALFKYDFGEGGEKEVETILKNSKKSDVVTLMNLLPRVDDQHKTRVYTVITNYTPAPQGHPKDSIPRFNSKELNEWIQQFQKEWKEEMKQNMKELQENLKNMNKDLQENLSKIPNIEYNFDNENFDEELQQKIQENIEKHMEKLGKLNEVIVIPDELIEKTIQESLEKASEEIERNGERIDREMERLQERMERMNERIQEDAQRQKEREEELKERDKEREEELKEKEKEREERLKAREKEREERMKEKQKDYEKYNFNWQNYNVETPEVESPEVESPEIESPEIKSTEVENPETPVIKKEAPENEEK